MIGHIAKAYRHGRLDARAGVKRPWGEGGHLRRVYGLGHRDETARMKRARRLPQLELSLPGEKRPPTVPQDRRSHPRMAPGSPDTF